MVLWKGGGGGVAREICGESDQYGAGGGVGGGLVVQPTASSPFQVNLFSYFLNSTLNRTECESISSPVRY